MKARLIQTREENIVDITGHAGDELACAGVSTLAQTYIYYILDSQTLDFNELVFENGRVYARMKRNEESDTLFRFVKTGLGLIEREYQDKISLIA